MIKKMAEEIKLCKMMAQNQSRIDKTKEKNKWC